MHCPFVPFSSRDSIHGGTGGPRGRSPRKLTGFSVLEAQENPCKIHKGPKFIMNSQFVPFPPEIVSSTNFKFLQVAHLQASRYRPSNLVNQTFSYCNATLISFNRSNDRCYYRHGLSINPRLNTGGALYLSQLMTDAC